MLQANAFGIHPAWKKINGWPLKYPSKYFSKEASGGLKPFAQQATATSLTFPSELGKIDAAFSYAVNDSRYFAFIRY